MSGGLTCLFFCAVRQIYHNSRSSNCGKTMAARSTTVNTEEQSDDELILEMDREATDEETLVNSILISDVR